MVLLLGSAEEGLLQALLRGYNADVCEGERIRDQEAIGLVLCGAESWQSAVRWS